jgi:hypothetical protein
VPDLPVGMPDLPAGLTSLPAGRQTRLEADSPTEADIPAGVPTNLNTALTL